jgi:hypothetical protein
VKTTFDGIEMDLHDDGSGGLPAAEYDPLRTPYDVREQDFPGEKSFSDQLWFLLHYAVLAPSTHNTQPWRFAVLESEGIALYADYSRRMPVIDPGNRELVISLGAALFNLRVAAAHFAMPCEIAYNLSGDSERPVAVARIAPPLLGGRSCPAEEELVSLFPSIAGRHTNRNPFLLSRVPASVMLRLASCGADSQCELVFSTDGVVNERVGSLVAEAEQHQWADAGFRKDLAEWIRPGATPEADGIPGAAYSWTGPVAALGQYASRTLDQGLLRAAHDRNLCVDAPGLIAVTGEDSVLHWLEAGEVLERLLLTVVREGLQYSYFNMPVQVPQFRTQLKALLGCSAWPQLLLRVGYCLTPPAPTPRKPLQDVVLSQPMQ